MVLRITRVNHEYNKIVLSITQVQYEECRITARDDDDFVYSYLRFSGSAQINIVATYGLYSQARSYIIKLCNCLNSLSTKSQVAIIMRERMTTLYVHIFGSVHNSFGHYQHCSDFNMIKRDRILSNYAIA
jgi:hypothetical protein